MGKYYTWKNSIVIKIIDFSNSPSKANFIEFNPKHKPVIVMKFGKAVLKSTFFIQFF